MRCSATRRRLPRLSDGPLPARHERHLAGCLACRAEAARYRALTRRLAELRHVVVAAPPGLAGAVMAGIETPAPAPARTASGWRRLVEAGVAAMAGAGAAAFGTWIVMRHRRSPAARPG